MRSLWLHWARPPSNVLSPYGESGVCRSCPCRRTTTACLLTPRRTSRSLCAPMNSSDLNEETQLFIAWTSLSSGDGRGKADRFALGSQRGRTIRTRGIRRRCVAEGKAIERSHVLCAEAADNHLPARRRPPAEPATSSARGAADLGLGVPLRPSPIPLFTYCRDAGGGGGGGRPRRYFSPSRNWGRGEGLLAHPREPQL
jgi:hypothetical protein